MKDNFGDRAPGKWLARQTEMNKELNRLPDPMLILRRPGDQRRPGCPRTMASAAALEGKISTSADLGNARGVEDTLSFTLPDPNRRKPEAKWLTITDAAKKMVQTTFTGELDGDRTTITDADSPFCPWSSLPDEQKAATPNLLDGIGGQVIGMWKNEGGGIVWVDALIYLIFYVAMLWRDRISPATHREAGRHHRTRAQGLHDMGVTDDRRRHLWRRENANRDN